jgi:hypothetical protein
MRGAKEMMDFVHNDGRIRIIAIYVVKGLCGNEILYALKYLSLLREQLLPMISWKTGIDTAFYAKCVRAYLKPSILEWQA